MLIPPPPSMVDLRSENPSGDQPFLWPTGINPSYGHFCFSFILSWADFIGVKPHFKYLWLSIFLRKLETRTS